MHAQHFLIFGPLFHQFLKSATNLTSSRHFSGGGDKTADRSFYGYIGPEIIIYSGTPISTFFHGFFCSFHWIKRFWKKFFVIKYERVFSNMCHCTAIKTSAKWYYSFRKLRSKTVFIGLKLYFADFFIENIICCSKGKLNPFEGNFRLFQKDYFNVLVKMKLRNCNFIIVYRVEKFLWSCVTL